MSQINKSAEKRARQNEKRRIANKMEKSSIRTAAKQVTAAAVGKDKAAAQAALLSMISQIDTAARKGVVKKNAAARKKSRMQRLVNSLGV